jgi:putative DNA primase/helicase
MERAIKLQEAAAAALKLLPHHLRELCDGSGITDATLAAAGIYSETSRDTLQRMLKRKAGLKYVAPAIVFPYRSADGTNGQCRIKPDMPRKDRNGKPVKYESPLGEPGQIYLPPGVAELLSNPRQELLLTEGEKKALKSTQEGFPCIGLVGVWGWKVKDHERLLAGLEQITWQGREVYIVFDSDLDRKPDVQDAESRLAKLLIDRGAKVRCVRLPDGGPAADGTTRKLGLDDFLVARGAEGKRVLRHLLDEAIEPIAVGADTTKEPASKLDPAREAEAFLATGRQDGVSRLRFWRGGFHLWGRGRYVELQPSEVRGQLIVHLNHYYHHLTTSITANVMDQLKAQSLLSFGHHPPCWLASVAGCEDWHPGDVLAARNGIIHLPSLVAGKPAIAPATPRFFTPVATDLEFAIDAPPPNSWLSFLEQIWPNDPDSVATLQEWCGYCLTPDTRQQKMLLLVGPRRSGKGTTARVLRAVIGESNVAGPTLASLGTNFGLWPLLGKTLAIVSDARLGGRTDQGIVVERLLSITGEDAITVDRKHQEPVTGKLLTRLMILTNELPRLSDASGALSGRMIVLRMSESFYGREDIALTDKLLAERSGILLWAIEGWGRLHKRGYFIQPVTGDELHEQLEDITSPVGEFVRERCKVGAEFSTPTELLYSAWQTWCNKRGRDPTDEAVFGRDLRAAVPAVRRAERQRRKRRYRVYEGIMLIH